MKRLLSVILAMVLLLTMVACGNQSDEGGETPNVDNSQTQSQTESDVTKNEPSNDDKVTLAYAYKVSGKNIVVDVPNYQEINKGFTQLYIMHGEKYVAITAAKNSSATDLETAHDDAFAKFKENVQNYSYVNFLTVKNDSTETVNGVEVYKYEGTVNCGKDTVYDAYVIGYSFIMDGVPCTITGSVIDQAQSQDMIDEIKTTVEAMIKTLRSER